MRDRFMYFSCIYFENISNYWETNGLQQNIFGFFKTIYYIDTKTLLKKPQSHMYFKHMNEKSTMTASNPSTQLNAFF